MKINISTEKDYTNKLKNTKRDVEKGIELRRFEEEYQRKKQKEFILETEKFVIRTIVERELSELKNFLTEEEFLAVINEEVNYRINK